MLKSFLLLPAFLLLGYTFQQPTATPEAAPAPMAVVPAADAAMVNPYKPNAASMAHAKKMYGYDCALCHGANGDGKGDAVADMKLTMKDWTDPASLKGMTDGELFYIIKNGKGQMPGENGRVNDEVMWNMVVIVRSYAKK